MSNSLLNAPLGNSWTSWKTNGWLQLVVPLPEVHPCPLVGPQALVGHLLRSQRLLLSHVECLSHPLALRPGHQDPVLATQFWKLRRSISRGEACIWHISAQTVPVSFFFIQLQNWYGNRTRSWLILLHRNLASLIYILYGLVWRSLERLKSRNERLTAALERRKSESEQISMALSRHEADCSALHMALTYWSVWPLLRHCMLQQTLILQMVCWCKKILNKASWHNFIWLTNVY